MRALARLHNLLAGALLAVFALGLLGLATPRGEIYPFFSWFLFSETPNPKMTYEIAVWRLGTQKFDPPRPLSRIRKGALRGKFLNASHIIQRMGQAWHAQDKDTFESQRKLLESRYLPMDIEYALMEVQRDPLLAWKGQQPPGAELARFHAP